MTSSIDQNGTKSDIFDDLDIIQEYFNNLKCVNLNTSDNLSLIEIGSILGNQKLNYFEFMGPEYKYGNSIQSKTGRVFLYDCDNHYCVKFKNLKMIFYQQNYTTQDDYVIFNFKHLGVELDVEDVTDSYQDYESLELESINEPSIIIHRRYIEKLELNKCLEHDLNIVPTQSLHLYVTKEYANKSKHLVQYLNSHSVDKLDSEVILSW